MSGLFNEATSQYIDDNGKTRMLNYTHKGKHLSLMTSPLPPFDLPVAKKVSKASRDIVLKFIKDKKLKIISQDGNEKEIKGFWVETDDEDSDIYYGYIPILSSPPLRDVEFSENTKMVPLQKEDSKKSELQLFRRNKKIAEFLKIYTLYTYALHPDEFDENWFVVDPDHEYNIEDLDKKLVEGTSVMYNEDGYLIVPSEGTISKLMGYLQIKLANDKPGVMSLSSARKMDDYYQSISDFRTAPNQLIFTSENGIFRWKRDTARSESNRIVSQNLLSSATEPYFYKTHKIKNGLLHIIQNVRGGDLKNATAVAYKWIKDRVNVGYSDPDKKALPENISYVWYTNNGKGGKEKRGTKEYAPVMFYEDGTYGAILFLN